jgi:hypothetical protein
MKTTSIVMILGVAAGVFAVPAIAGNLAQFDGGIGVIPVSSLTPATATTPAIVNRNIVRGVEPPGQPWVIKDLRAEVKDDGQIRVQGRGLLLAGGNGVGGNANARLFATLICEAKAPFVEHSTPSTPATTAGVALEPNGDFMIDDVLTPAPVDCASPVLLIRNTGNRGWFAAGIPRI